MALTRTAVERKDEVVEVFVLCHLCLREFIADLDPSVRRWIRVVDPLPDMSCHLCGSGRRVARHRSG